MEDPEVPTEHLHEEIHHQTEHSRERWTLGVALSSSLLAGLAAIASLMAGHHSNEAMVSQIESSDQWSYYQSKGIKETALRSKAEILDALGKPVSPADNEKVAQDERDKEQIRKKAEDLEKDAQAHLRTHEVLASSVTMFQIAISVGAISVLMRSRAFWLVSLILGAVGVAFLCQSFFTPGAR
ncbi:MAG: DUF4337 domain-containing protein [Verrucomicrobia bacterium]|nr:DUF4337 domain-containing protein [Verrucomicrobiota bacterium]MBV8376519.1 DUF4337 domain-containing protein [Verrucomicrobiota bacterium]